MASEVFESTQAKDNELRTVVAQARERASAYPEDHDAQMALAKACADGKKMWDACEKELKALDQASTNDEERAMLVREINMARNLAKAYDSEAVTAIEAATKTTKAGKFFGKMESAGEAMQTTGRSMKNTGRSMTSGCTVPIIVVIILILLLLIIL